MGICKKALNFTLSGVMVLTGWTSHAIDWSIPTHYTAQAGSLVSKAKTVLTENTELQAIRFINQAMDEVVSELGDSLNKIDANITISLEEKKSLGSEALNQLHLHSQVMTSKGLYLSDAAFNQMIKALRFVQKKSSDIGEPSAAQLSQKIQEIKESIETKTDSQVIVVKGEILTLVQESTEKLNEKIEKVKQTYLSITGTELNPEVLSTLAQRTQARLINMATESGRNVVSAVDEKIDDIMFPKDENGTPHMSGFALITMVFGMAAVQLTVVPVLLITMGVLKVTGAGCLIFRNDAYCKP